MNRIGRIVSLLVTASTIIGAAAVLLMMVQIIINVTVRGLFSYPVPGTTTAVTSYYMVIVAFLPLALAERMNSHITVEVVAQMLAARPRQWLLALTWTLAAIVTGWVCYAEWGEAVKAFGYGSFTIEQNTPIPIWPGYFVLPIGFGLYALVLIYRLACSLAGVKTLPEFEDDEAVDPAAVHGGE